MEWVFTFGCGQPLRGRCVRIAGSYGEAREKMCSVFGQRWAFQYSAEDWERRKNDPDRLYDMEREIDLKGEIYCEPD